MPRIAVSTDSAVMTVGQLMELLGWLDYHLPVQVVSLDFQLTSPPEESPRYHYDIGSITQNGSVATIGITEYREDA
jgi:hypothetical protein